ncbi:MAG: Hsp33 family molecular chaperone HslO [Pseudomonadota bacterium]
MLENQKYSDIVQPFLIDHSSIRGRFVRLENVLNNILNAHNYHHTVSYYLAEQIVLASLLSATLQKDGILTVQAKGDGAIKFIVVDIMASGIIRGYAEVNDEKISEITKKSKNNILPLNKIMGKGYLAVTLDEGGSKERHQSLVELNSDSISDAFSEYFRQSNQVEIAIKVIINKPNKDNKSWSASGIIIERMPIEGGNKSEISDIEQNEIWERTKLFMSTLKEDEMLAPDITPQNLLYRLFNEDGVWVYKLQHLNSGCRCSRKRIRAIFKSIPQEELLATLDETGKMKVNCQFCNKQEIFTKADIKRIYTPKKK